MLTWTPYSRLRQYLNEGIMGSPLAGCFFKIHLSGRQTDKTNTPAADLKKAIEAATTARAGFKEGEDLPSDEKILAKTCMMFYNDVDKNQHPDWFLRRLKSQLTEA